MPTNSHDAYSLSPKTNFDVVMNALSAVTNAAAIDGDDAGAADQAESRLDADQRG